MSCQVHLASVPLGKTLTHNFLTFKYILELVSILVNKKEGEIDEWKYSKMTTKI